jgi:outer membrane protein OmpA-like peptidoglycan-associated protein
MNRTIKIALSIFLAFLVEALAQQNSSFFPKNLGKGVNTEYDEINPVLSPDGKTLYFTRVNHPLNTYGKNDSQDVWYSELQPDNTWSEAKHFDNFLNGARYNAVLAVSNDGKKLLISGRYKQNKKWYANGISIVSKFGEEWSIPEKLKIPALNRLSEGQSMNAFLSYDGTYLLLAITKRFNGKKLNLYVSKNEDGKFQKPINLGKTINAKSTSEEAPFLANDNEVLYFASKRETGKGNFDIYKSSRMSASWKEWTTPVLMSDTLNSDGYESYFKINKKGTFGFFASTKNAIGGSDIFKIKLKEEYPYIVLKGKVVNKNTNEPMVAKKDFTITVNDLKADSLKINYDSATYTLKLPFGKKYVLKALVKNYKTIPDTLDATNINEYTEIAKNLKVEPIPYVVVKGTFIDKNTGLVIPPGANPKLVVNGVVNDSAAIELSNSSYTVKLPYGKSYTLSLQAFKYIPQIDSLNLSNITEYQDMTKALYATKEVEKVVFVQAKAIITGKVYDKKTGKILAPNVKFSVLVDSLPEILATIDSANAEYRMEVDLGRGYTVGAKANGYYAVFERIDLRKEKGNIKIIKDLVLAPVVVGQAIRMNNIFFISGKAQLTPNSYPELDKLAKFLLDNSSIKVEIAGHTDNVGKKDKNVQLSRWRARAVQLYLVSKGVPVERVTFNGYGDAKPVADNKTPWGKSQNRRVEFVIKAMN